jgi:hypothetical protein
MTADGRYLIQINKNKNSTNAYVCNHGISGTNIRGRPTNGVGNIIV